ncbi:hypothetical protein MPER_04137 [Moniliophthora perniciosa FA553]|nr:hypothetical protein MPER_04137 [Moniliophthora perniciosa FA553]
MGKKKKRGTHVEAGVSYRGSSEQGPFLYQAPQTVPHKYGGRHVRKISVTPYDISLLTDQNTELLLKVEKLEAESAGHELAGRKMLKKMEKEINVLRDELEAVRAKEAQSAQRAKEKEEAALHRKEEKAKVRMMRSKSGPVHFGQRETDPFGETKKDFAPAGPLSSLFSRSTKHAPSYTSISESQEEDSSDTDPLTPTSATSFEDQQREFIAQVLSKMAELEETNSRLESQQADTAARLMAIQMETESLGRLYEGIDDEVEIVQGEPSPETELLSYKPLRDTLNIKAQPWTFGYKLKQTWRALDLAKLNVEGLVCLK